MPKDFKLVNILSVILFTCTCAIYLLLPVVQMNWDTFFISFLFTPFLVWLANLLNYPNINEGYKATIICLSCLLLLSLIYLVVLPSITPKSLFYSYHNFLSGGMFGLALQIYTQRQNQLQKSN